MTEEQNKLAEEIERHLAPDAIYSRWRPSMDDMRLIVETLREPATEAVLEELLACPMSDPNRGKSGEGKFITISSVRPALIDRLRALKGKGASHGADAAQDGSFTVTAVPDSLGRTMCTAEAMGMLRAPEPSGEFVRVPRGLAERAEMWFNTLSQYGMDATFSNGEATPNSLAMGQLAAQFTELLAACPDEQKG